jgi:low temperature requirement protein LtrA
MGTAFTDQPFEAARLLALAIAFTETVALWWCYFQRSERIGIEAGDTAEAAGAVGWWGTWTLTLIVLALIGIAVADQLAIADPRESVTLDFTILAFGGAAVFLVAQALFVRLALGNFPPSRLLALATLAILAALTAPFSLIVGIGAASAVLVAVAIGDTVREPVLPRG